MKKFTILTMAVACAFAVSASALSACNGGNAEKSADSSSISVQTENTGGVTEEDSASGDIAAEDTVSSDVVATEEEWQSIFSVDNFNNFTVNISSDRQTTTLKNGVCVSSSSLIRNGEAKYGFVYDADAYMEYRGIALEGALTGNYYYECTADESSYVASTDGTGETYESTNVYSESGIFCEGNYFMASKKDTDDSVGAWTSKGYSVYSYAYKCLSGNLCGISGVGLESFSDYLILTNNGSTYSGGSPSVLYMDKTFGTFELKDGAYTYSYEAEYELSEEIYTLYGTVTDTEDVRTFKVIIKDGKCVSIELEYYFYLTTETEEYTETMTISYSFTDYGTTAVEVPDEVIEIYNTQNT